MRTRISVVAAALAAALVAVVLFAPASSSVDGARQGRFVIGAADDTTTPFNLVSEPALIDHTYEGRDLRRTAVLHRDLVGTVWRITYVGDTGRPLAGTLMVPRGPGRHPLVVSMHGYMRPTIYRNGMGLLREERVLLRRGFAVLHPDYRNYGDSHIRQAALVREPKRPLGYPADVLDAITALRRAHPRHIDMNRIALFGRSMGGGVALQVAEARPTWFRSLLLYSPVSSVAGNNYSRWVARDASLRTRVGAAYGSPVSDPGFWYDASSANFLARLSMPVSISHGTADPVCPIAWSEDTAARMRADGVKVTLTRYPGEVHRFHRGWHTFMRRAVYFLTVTTADTERRARS